MTKDERENSKSPSRLDPLAMISKLAAAEERVLASPFVAPMLPGGRVTLSVEGVNYDLIVDDRTYTGWAILKAVSAKVATVCGAASLEQRRAYLQLLPRFRLVVLEEIDGQFWALQAKKSDTRADIAGPVTVNLVDRVGRFETVCARFDGSAFWYETTDRGRDPKIARTLREALQADVEPDKLHVLNAVPQEKVAYKMLWLRKHPELQGVVSFAPLSDAERIEQALDHAGGQLESYRSVGDDRVSVRYTVDGHTHVSTIRPSDLSVVSAGICLSGQDELFDLTSLVGVMREGGYDEYW